MKQTPQLIIMLTNQDKTVANAPEIFSQCKNCDVAYWGFKEEGLPPDAMKALYAQMKACGKTAVLEVVRYTEAECLEGAKTAVECGCDILMGTLFFDSVNEYCKAHHLRYMPFVGNVSERPSVLTGTVGEMVAQAKEYLQKGVYGFDLLGYRFTGDATRLIREFVSEVDAPVCVAGSIDSFERMDVVTQSGAWAYTVGSALFDHRFGTSFEEQINCICRHQSARGTR